MKKDLEYYMSLPYKIELIPGEKEGSFVIKFTELPGCITYAETIEELAYMMKDAKKSWILTSLQCGEEIPEPATRIATEVA